MKENNCKCNKESGSWELIYDWFLIILTACAVAFGLVSAFFGYH